MSGLRRALIALAVAGLALGLAAFALVTTSEREDVPGPSVVLALTLGWAFIGAGLYAWWRRPENRVGALMTMVGFVWFLGALTSAESAWAFTLGLALNSLWIAALVHMLVAFPTGRVAPGLERNVVRLGWIAVLILSPLSLLVFEDPDCGDCPDNVLLVWSNDTVATVLEAVGVLVLVVVLGALVPTASDIAVDVTVGFITPSCSWGALVVVLIRRWRGFGKVQRRALAPVLWTGTAVAVVALLIVLAASSAPTR